VLAAPVEGAAATLRLYHAPARLLSHGPVSEAPALRAQAAEEAAAWPEMGAAFADEAALAELEPDVAPGLVGIRYDICFPVAPAAATRAMAALARALGARVLEGQGAAGVAREGTRAIGVVAADGAVHPAGAVVVAAGPWTPAIVDPSGAWRPIRPFWGVIVELELARPPRHVLDEAVPEGGAGRPETGFSLVTATGRSSLGSTFLADEPEPGAFAARLRERGATYVPAIATTPTASTRACARPVSADGRPLVGAVPGADGLFVAAGHGPWGLSTGPASARHVASLVLGEPDPRSPLVAAGTDAGRFGAPPR
jgi:glycine/D-amino acid oxidase-like deaminating enzyme